VKSIDVAMNSDRVLCGDLGLHPGHIVGVLKHVEEINFYVHFND
jgi:hypothetical protein